MGVLPSKHKWDCISCSPFLQYVLEILKFSVWNHQENPEEMFPQYNTQGDVFKIFNYIAVCHPPRKV